MREAIEDCGTNLELGHLAIKGTRYEALTEELEAVHLGIADRVVCELNRADIQGFRVDADMHLAPLAAIGGTMLSRFPFPFTYHLDARAAHQEVQTRSPRFTLNVFWRGHSVVYGLHQGCDLIDFRIWKLRGAIVIPGSSVAGGYWGGSDAGGRFVSSG